MPQLAYDLDDESNPARFFAAWDTAGILLAELAKRGATKAEIDSLRKATLDRYTDMKRFEKGIPGLIKIDQRAAEEAMQDVVESIFDRVAFR